MLAMGRIAGDRFRALLAVLVALTLVNCLWSAQWGLPDGASAATTATWAVDTVAPLAPLSEASSAFTRAGTESVIYPVFHYVVLAAAYAPYVAAALLTGKLDRPGGEFPYGAVDPQSFFVHLTLLASLVSALMAAGCVLASFKIAGELFDRRTAIWSALLSALIPPLAYYGAMPNLDVPYLFWMLLAVWQLLRAARTQRAAAYALCGVFASLAVATKDQAAGFLITLPLVVPWLVHRDLRRRTLPAGWLAVLRDRRVWIAGGAAALAFVIANNLLFGFDGYQRHLQFADDFYAANLAVDGPGLLARQPALLAHSATLLVQMIGIPTLLLMAAGLWRTALERRWLALFLLLSAAGYYLSIIVPTVAHSRYLLGIVLLLMPFAARAVVLALDTPRGLWRLAGLVTLAAAIIVQSLLTVHLHWTLSGDSRYAMERWVRTHVSAGATIESSTQARYLPRLADDYQYTIVGNSFSSTRYNLVGEELTPQALQQRAPDYVLVLADSWVSGDPTRVEEPRIRTYYDELLGGRAGYEVVADFQTPTWLPYRQITAGTQPRSILLKRRS